MTFVNAAFDICGDTAGGRGEDMDRCIVPENVKLR